jgi:hypothetical protein
MAFKKASSTDTANLQHDLHPEGTANCACQNKRAINRSGNISSADYKRFLAQKKRVNEQTRYLEQREKSSSKISR